MQFLPSENPKEKTGLTRRLARAGLMALAGFAAAAVPLHLFLRRELRDAAGDVRAQGWPIRLAQVLFARHIQHWIHLEGVENLPQGSYLLAANHGYRSGVDGFILGHVLATVAGRVPRILTTSDHRDWMVRMERWVLHHYGIALLVPDESKRRRGDTRRGLSDIMAEYLKAAPNHAVIIFPAGRAETDFAAQLRNWSTGAVVAAWKSGSPVVPVAFGGLPSDWTPETLVIKAIDHHGPNAPFQIHIRIGKPITVRGDARTDTELLRLEIAALMHHLPGVTPVPEPAERPAGPGA